MQRSLVILGIITCVVGTFLGIVCTFFYPDTIRQYLDSDLVDVIGLLSVFGFLSFVIGFLLSIIGAVSKKKEPKKTKLIPFSRYFNH